MSLRPSTPEDTDALFDVWRRAVAATHNFVSPADRQAIAQLVREEYLPNADLVVATEPNGRPYAFMGMTGANIDALFVEPEQHRRGAGRALVDHAKRLHPAGVTVDVNEANDGAILFYERVGFRAVGRSATDEHGRPYPLVHMRWAD